MKKRQLRGLGISALTTGAIGNMARQTGGSLPGGRITRKTLIKLAGAGAAVLASGGRLGRTTASAAPGCILTPEQTEGPYYIAREKVRSNLAERHPGVPLRLRFKVVDATTCKPIKGAVVDIWHCDAGGVYSGFQSASTGGPPGGSGPTDKATFLRGLQFTGAGGNCTFQSIYPGWYRGRTVHIHVKVHLGRSTLGNVVHTGQVYFSDALTTKVYESAAYRARASARDTFNTSDSIFQSGGRQSMLSMKHDGHGGFIGTITLGVKRL